MSTPTISQQICTHLDQLFAQLETANQRAVWFLSEAMRQSGKDSLTVSLVTIPDTTIEITDNKDGTVTLTRKEQAPPVTVQEPELVQS